MVAVAFNVPVAEFHTDDTLARRPGYNRLGPDLLSDDFDTATAIANIQSQADAEIATALLRQSVLAGIGNEFKSEVLFEAGIHPFRLAGSLTTVELHRLIDVARRQLSDNVRQFSPRRRTTRRVERSENLWVYNRSGQPCRKCGEPIAARRHAADGRLTFWCPRCQRS
jgi:endonuclease-8